MEATPVAQSPETRPEDTRPARTDAGARNLIDGARAACTGLKGGADAVANAEAMGELKYYAAELAAELERRMP